MTSLNRLPKLDRGVIPKAFIVFAVLVAGLECVALHEGVAHEFKDSPAVWSLVYSEALEDHEGVVVLGSSRAALGIDPTELESRLGRRVYNLTINGGNPLPVLNRLDQEGYSGIVIAEFMERRVLGEDAAGWRNARQYFAHIGSAAGRVECAISAACDRVFRTRSNRLSLVSWLSALPTLRFPPHPSREVRVDRFHITDIDRIDGSRLESRWAVKAQNAIPLTGQRLEHRIRQLTWRRESLERRGGRLFWIRLPTSGRVRDLEDATFPREAFTGATQVHGWHYRDNPTTAQMHCFDGSHLTPNDAVRLTRVVAEWVAEHLGE